MLGRQSADAKCGLKKYTSDLDQSGLVLLYRKPCYVTDVKGLKQITYTWISSYKQSRLGGRM